MFWRQVLVVVCMLWAQLGWAEGTWQISGCQDKQGKAIASVEDINQAWVARQVVEEGRAMLRVNSLAVPQLLPETRLFVFAHECARHYLGFAPDAPRTLAAARAADCTALRVLLNSSGWNAKTQIAAVENDWSLLQEAASEQLPGPARALQLAQCSPSGKPTASRGALRLDTQAAPQVDGNRCAQACGASLYRCGRGTTCEASFAQCTAQCAK